MNPGVEKKTVSEGVKPIESLPRIFCGLVIHIKNTFCKKIGSKRSFQPSAVVRAIYPPSIWGPSRQLDDQHRNTNMNNKDHLVGQLTTCTPAVDNPSNLVKFAVQSIIEVFRQSACISGCILTLAALV